MSELKTKPKKCTKKSFCPGMFKLSDDPTARGRRLWVANFFKPKTGKFSDIAIFKSQEHGEVALNFCPWCGGALR